MYLIRVEPNFRMGLEEGAAPLKDIDTLRERVGPNAIANLDIGSILLERKKNWYLKVLHFTIVNDQKNL